MEKILKFIGIEFNQHPLFTEGSALNLFATDRVFADSKGLTPLVNKLFINNLSIVSGYNATGKTTFLKTVFKLLKLTTKKGFITDYNDIFFGDNDIIITLYFYGTDKKLYKNQITFAKNISDEFESWIIKDDIIYIKKINTLTNKKNFFDFDSNKTIEIIDKKTLHESKRKIVNKQFSLFFSLIVDDKYQTQNLTSTISKTEVNKLGPIYLTEYPTDFLNLLDDSIEYFKIKRGKLGIFFELKFKNNKEIIRENNFNNLSTWLSSGTIRSLDIFVKIVNTLKTDGILLIDEIENHLNVEIINLIIKCFQKEDMETKGTLIFSTHYPELLDQINRADNINIFERTKNYKVKISSYASKKIRPELKKSNAFKASYNMHTSPKYEYISKALCIFNDVDR